MSAYARSALFFDRGVGMSSKKGKRSTAKRNHAVDGGSNRLRGTDTSGRELRYHSHANVFEPSRDNYREKSQPESFLQPQPVGRHFQNDVGVVGAQSSAFNCLSQLTSSSIGSGSHDSSNKAAWFAMPYQRQPTHHTGSNGSIAESHGNRSTQSQGRADGIPQSTGINGSVVFPQGTHQGPYISDQRSLAHVTPQPIIPGTPRHTKRSWVNSAISMLTPFRNSRPSRSRPVQQPTRSVQANKTPAIAVKAGKERVSSEMVKEQSPTQGQADGGRIDHAYNGTAKSSVIVTEDDTKARSAGSNIVAVTAEQPRLDIATLVIRENTVKEQQVALENLATAVSEQMQTLQEVMKAADAKLALVNQKSEEATRRILETGNVQEKTFREAAAKLHEEQQRQHDLYLAAAQSQVVQAVLPSLRDSAFNAVTECFESEKATLLDGARTALNNLASSVLDSKNTTPAIRAEAGALQAENVPKSNKAESIVPPDHVLSTTTEPKQTKRSTFPALIDLTIQRASALVSQMPLPSSNGRRNKKKRFRTSGSAPRRSKRLKHTARSSTNPKNACVTPPRTKTAPRYTTSRQTEKEDSCSDENTSDTSRGEGGSVDRSSLSPTDKNVDVDGSIVSVRIVSSSLKKDLTRRAVVTGEPFSNISPPVSDPFGSSDTGFSTPDGKKDCEGDAHRIPVSLSPFGFKAPAPSGQPKVRGKPVRTYRKNRRAITAIFEDAFGFL